MEEKRKKFGNEKGSVTLFVTATMLLIITLLVLMYAGQINKINNQKKQLTQIEQNYKVDDGEMDSTYERLVENSNNNKEEGTI